MNLSNSINRTQARQEIINFFTETCNNKLNKNVYFKTYYIKRNKEHIYDYIQDFYKNTELESASIAQKYYHIFWNIDPKNKPTTKFYNFAVGYRKGKRTFSSRTYTYLKNAINEFIPINTNLINFSSTTARQLLSSYLTSTKYKQLLKQVELLSYILYHQKSLNFDNYTKLIHFYHNKTPCICGKSRKIITPLTVRKTCGDPLCISKIQSDFKKQADLIHLQTPAVKCKRVISRKWYKHAAVTKEKISLTNKKTWTKEKRYKQIQTNKKNGVYKRLSQKIKQKILTGIYTPQSKNRFTHTRLKSSVTGVKNYRSSWELKYHECHPQLLYEHIRIPYTYNNNTHIYIVDFWDNENKTAIEIKPSSMLSDARTVAKHKALKQWCIERNYKCIIVTEKNYNFLK